MTQLSLPDHAIRRIVQFCNDERQCISEVADECGWGLACEAAMDTVNAIEEAIPESFFISQPPVRKKEGEK